MSTYTKAPKEVTDLVDQTMKQCHGPKHEAGVRVKVLMAHPNVDQNDEPTGPAILAGGYKALAKIKILSLPNRVAYGFDAEMQLDSDHWDESSDEERVAVLDHELTHLELAVDDKGGVKRDDAGRPKLRMRKHDYAFGWFSTVAHRHGESSLEVRQARALLDSEDYQQCWLPGMSELEEAAA